MLDNPVPSSPSTPAPHALCGPEAVQPSANGVAAKPLPEDPSLRHTFGQTLRYYALYVGLLAGLWAVAFAVLLLTSFTLPEAIGFATVAALVGSFFVRSFVPQLAEKARASQAAHHHHNTDSAREIIETVVFVVVLVLLLKSFTAEAFVIPTGSMAESLYGYQKIVECPQCKLKFPVNCSSEVDPSDGSPPIPVDGCTCPNCRLDITLMRPGQQASTPARNGTIPDPGWRSGDRVLVGKYVYDLLDKDPDRLDVVVFKFPGDSNFPRTGPVKQHVPINYIKRLIGLPGETIAIHRGKLWVLPPDKSPRYDDVEKAKGDPGAQIQLWKFEHMHHDDEQALTLFKNGEFAIIRKKPENLLSMRRIVYDNDHQAQDLQGEQYQRWLPGQDSGWQAVGKDTKAFQFDGKGEGWLRYRHVLRGSPDRPQLITDFMGYNTWSGDHRHQAPRENWASDLMIECQVTVEKKEGTFLLELSRGKDRFQAVFNLTDGKCTLYRLEGGKREEMKSADTKLTGGTHLVRFANIDDRLTVWVDEKLPFGAGVEYGPVRDLAPVKENDLDRPVSVGAEGAKVKVSKLKVYRDTYYTTARTEPRDADVPEFKPDDPQTWDGLAKAPTATYYVQPGHYLCLGDNSPESSDGRSWGLVPRRLLLGRALVVYYPFGRAGLIR
jgi:signal peptidase I